MRKLAVFIIAAAIATMPVAAQEAPAGANPPGWQTWTWGGACNAVLFPESAPIAALESERAYVSLRHNPEEGSRNAISFVSGLSIAEGVTGRVDVDGKIYDLLVFQGAGFVSAGEREDGLLADLLAGTELRVTWTTPESLINQDYKVAGLAQAKRTIDTACYGDES